MAGLREVMRQNPMIGWAIAAVLMLLAAVMFVSRLSRADETDQLTAMVTIRCSETGEEWEVPRGVMEKMLYLRKPPLNPNEGLPNPKTGKLTGFPVDSWKETIERINAEVAADAQAAKKQPSTAPGSPGDR
jgi:hypothetical protein